MLNGVINIKKEKGFTSHDVVAIVRRTLNIKKVGHTGTLDPDAEGVLPICVGKATKLSDLIMNGDKTYVATLKLGITTTTEDGSGEILEEKAVDFNEDKIRDAVANYIGVIEQIPPMYSAIKIKGKKLYELAREGKEIERKSRKVTITNITILKFLPPDALEIEVQCSKGTYIRTLCADIGNFLGCGGHMATLVRTKTGNFSIEDGITLEQLKNLTENNELGKVFQSVEGMFSSYTKIIITPSYNKLLYNGARLPEKAFLSISSKLEIGQSIVVYDYEENFIGIYLVLAEENNLFIKPDKMLI